MITRRTFFGAAAAAPVAAKEAAKRMGLESITTLGGGGGAPLDSIPSPSSPIPGAHYDESELESELEWAKEVLWNLDSPEVRADRARTASHMATRLDADLAAMRSLSPSAAYALQRQRCELILREQRKADMTAIIRRIEKQSGKALLKGFGLA